MAVTAPAELKRCSRCLCEKPLDEFHRNTQRADGRHPWCAECKNRSALGSYKRGTPEHRVKCRQRSMKVRYGVTPDMLQALYEQQEGCCAICGFAGVPPAALEPAKRADILHIDHDHATGEIRGLLCVKCNLLLGYAKDDSKVLIRALHYVNERGPTPSQ